jgi:RNA polymerase sigma-70 factor (ECF subfamily)
VTPENRPSLEALAAQSARVHRLALAIAQDRHVAEDLAQDAWVSLLRGTGPAPRNLPGWLAGTMGNLLRTRNRSERRRADHERASAREDLEPGSESALEHLELHEALVRAVRELKEPYRTTVLLRWFEDLEPLEIARRTGVPVRTVHTRVSRALEMLRAKLHRAGYGESWSLGIAVASMVWLRNAGEAALAVKTKTKILLAAATLGAASLTVAVLVPRSTSSSSTSSAAPRLVQPLDEGPTPESPAAESGAETRQAVVSEPAPPVDAGVARSKAAISGVVLVRGQVPSEPITLILIDDGDPEKPERQRVTVSTDGEFSFDDLAEGFRGAIRLPRRYSLADFPPRRRVVTTTAPSEGLVLDVERAPTLKGRLISRATGLSVEDSKVTAKVTWEDMGQTMFGADVEPGGQFFIPVSESRPIAAMELDVRSPEGLVGKFSFSRDQIPPDLDLGVLALDAGLTAHVVVLDPDRIPIAGARLQGHGMNSLSVETDAGGRASLKGMDSGAKFTALARGFDPVQRVVPSSGETIEIVLERATRLRVRVLDPTGAPASGVQLEVSAAAPMFAGSGGAPDRFLVPQVPADGAIAGQEVNGKRFFVWFTTDDEGVIALQSLVPGLPLQFSIVDELDTRVLQEPVKSLRPQEVRELELRLPCFSRTLSGVVEDASGRPIERARVGLGTEGNRVFLTAQADGRFRFEHLFGTSADLDVERRGYVTTRLKDLLIQQEPYDLRVVLEPGRDARVRVVDELGSIVETGSLSARLPSGDRTWYAENSEDGVRMLLDLPIQELDVHLELAGKTFQASLGPRQEELELRVPACGSLEVACAPDPALPRKHLGVRLQALDDEGIELWRPLDRQTATSAVFTAVIPGRYELGLATWQAGPTDDDPGELVPHGPTVTVQITAGESARIELR